MPKRIQEDKKKDGGYSKPYSLEYPFCLSEV